MDYPANSHRSKEERALAKTEERPKVEPVISGTVKLRKKNELSKFVDLFISQDAPKIKSWVLHDVIMPAFKKAVMGTIDRLLNGGHGSGYSSDYSSDYAPSKPKVRYSQYSEEPNYHKATGTILAQNTVEYPDIEYPSRGAAERVLISMREIHREFNNVSLAELFELSKVEHPYTYTKYGWTSLADAKVVERGDGYFIKLPQATLITNR